MCNSAYRTQRASLQARAVIINGTCTGIDGTNEQAASRALSSRFAFFARAARGRPPALRCCHRHNDIMQVVKQKHP